jgi:alkanesulfonate monooxygenase SsuD/methylene tetrahydromethanopterin reductase-like flavin-dependent oxidoreductase (luciferase family)
MEVHVQFVMRFDMRAPAEGPASKAELYQAALDIGEWAEKHGCSQLIVSEHHASDDGFLPSPLTLAAALAARTRTASIQVSALILPLHDPIKMAEDMAVLDILSQGRVHYIVGVGYRPEEYAMFGRSFQGRGRRMEECIETLRRAWTGEPFEYEGRRVRVTPTPLQPEGPRLIMGGNSPQAARRAARFGLGLFTQGADPSIGEIYAEECRKAGREPGLCIVPPANFVTAAFFSRDPERAWQEMGPSLLHDARSYAAWLEESHVTPVKSNAQSIDELKQKGHPYRIFTPEEAIACGRTFGIFSLQPLCGGLPPKLAWESLEVFANDVLPALKGS